MTNALSCPPVVRSLASGHPARPQSTPDQRRVATTCDNPAVANPTLHAEIAAILADGGWATTSEIADEVNRRGNYRKRAGTAVDSFQIHGRTKNYPQVFERDGSRVRLRPLPPDPAVADERALRLARFELLEPTGSVAAGVTPSALNDDAMGMRLFYGGRGIWYDSLRTRGLLEPGVAVAVLHTGRHYPDDLLADGVIYHYPSTATPGKDQTEVEAMKNARLLGLPVFVVVQRYGLRDVHLAWVEDYDDEKEIFLISFGLTQTPSSSVPEPDAEWKAFDPKPKTRQEVERRERDPRFAFRVMKLYGSACAACGISITRVIDAAHVIPVAAKGSSHPRNGIPLCATHHRLFDANAFAINPHTLEIVTTDAYSLDDMGVRCDSISHLAASPHPEALQWRWDAVFE